MTTVRVFFHGTQTGNGAPLVFTQIGAEGSLSEITKTMADSLAGAKAIVFNSRNQNTVVNTQHIALIEVEEDSD